MNDMAVFDVISDDATRWRHHIHANPETAFEEKATADFIITKLREFGLDVHSGIGGTGVVGILKRGSGGKSVGLRADMDALFIHEENDVEYRSRVDGKMHACGHDGHSAMLLGAARYLAEKGDFNGTVYFIFQPAEETGDEHCGGHAMIKDGLFEKFPMNMIFGLHNFPNIPEGHFMVRSGPMLASIDTFEFRVKSRFSHPAAQFDVADPLLTAAGIVQDMHVYKARYLNPAEPVVLSITQFQSGDPKDRQSVHVTPDEALVRGTLYTLNDAVRDAFEAGLEKIVRQRAEMAGATYDYRFERGYPVVQNDKSATLFAVETARSIVGDDAVVDEMQPALAAEDFAFMLREVPGCYILLGTEQEGLGMPCQLHNPHYDFNDAVIPVGIRYWVALAERFLCPSA